MNKELNELMAEGVMGWHKGRLVAKHLSTQTCWLDAQDNLMVSIISWNPSGTDNKSMGQAMRCVEKMKDRGWLFSLNWDCDETWRANLYKADKTSPGDILQGEHDEFPEIAICEAIAEAVKDE